MRVIFSKRGRRDARRIDTWWRENRPAAPDLFEQELARLVSLLETPEAKLGLFYGLRRGKVVKRVLMEQTEHHLYIRQDGPNLITVITVWSAVRGRSP